MKRVWMYSVAASKDPNNIGCVVPWRVDDSLIFFGPCKKRMRERLRSEFLGNNTSHSPVKDQIFIVGVNGGNTSRERKVVWWGRISEVMTFYEADKRLKGKRFQKLRKHPCSPLHVRPIIEGEILIGYKHHSNEHNEKEAWISDLVSNPAMKNVLVDGRKITLKSGSPWKVFDRDCCMLLENAFFAQGAGIKLDETAVDILRDAQDREDIDDYAVFGRTKNNQANGLRGTFLEMNDTVADRFIAWLEGKTTKTTNIREEAGKDGLPKTHCS